MQYMTIVAFLAATVAAGPQIRAYPSIDQITVAQANNACGNNMQVTCCNKVTNTPAGNAVGNGAGILNNLSLFDQCSKLDVNVLAIANNLLNKECQANAACCQNSGGSATGGLVNVALPCIALSSLI
ncbi:fungal hydrophobin domain-containing protein [Fusarium coicis]|nr:fungal hydrophobin domain-containing protein [Fusarium coicis]